MDLYFTESGDIAVSSGGDIAVVNDIWRDYLQQAYIRLMTTISDYALYPTLGADLEQLIGMPQSKETGDFGISLIRSALSRGGSRLEGLDINIKAVPISHQVIRFDIYITAGSRTEMVLSIQQDLGLN